MRCRRHSATNDVGFDDARVVLDHGRCHARQGMYSRFRRVRIAVESASSSSSSPSRARVGDAPARAGQQGLGPHPRGRTMTTVRGRRGRTARASTDECDV